MNSKPVNEATIADNNGQPQFLPDAPSFDYDALDRDVAKAVRNAAARVKALHQKTVLTVLDTGIELLEVKRRLSHGQFGAWMKAEFGWSDRTARSYMRAAQVFGAKPEIVSALPLTTLYRLAAVSVPDEVRTEVIRRLETGRPMTVEHIHRFLEDRRETRRQMAGGPDAAAGGALMVTDDRTSPSRAEEAQRVQARKELVQWLQQKLGSEFHTIEDLLARAGIGARGLS